MLENEKSLLWRKGVGLTHMSRKGYVETRGGVRIYT